MNKKELIKFTAYINDQRIISVLCSNEKDAEQEIKESLSRPGRVAILQKWIEYGKVIKS